MGIHPYRPDDVPVPEDIKLPPPGSPPSISPNSSQTKNAISIGKPSTPQEIEAFKKDWQRLDFTQMCLKYNVPLKDIMAWGKELLQ